ncbi:hypothetical protein AAE478_003397 [Parahypoxylon ruwenzoriense]
MSGDQPISSFGDPNAQPPTPKQTPTSAAFPSSVFETPKNNNRASFDESSGWTPRFAEEYSVFNSTPGNLRGPHASFVDFSVSTPYLSSNHKRPLSAENIAADIASHVTHFSPNPNLPLPPVDPSRRLPSSPGPLVTGHSPTEPGFQTTSQQLSSKKVCRDTPQEAKTQTATPPPSTHKGKRRLAPKLQTGSMQNESFEQEFVAGTPQQQHMTSYISTPTDLFGYPMSAPATAPGFGDSRMFWDSDMNAMDIDFSGGSENMFQTQGHRAMNSLDWGKANDIFRDTGTSLPQTQENNNPPAKKERALAPKPAPPNLDTNVVDSLMFTSSFHTSADDSFAMVSQSTGVNPGLLFTRPPSSGMEAAPFDPLSQPPLMQPFTQLKPAPLPAKQTKRGALRRSASNKEIDTGKKVNRASASSPIKPSDRPGLSRGFGENMNRKPVGKIPSLPNLVPAARPVPQNSGRSISQGPRTGGRISPVKNHRRVPSLSSIPETPTARTQTSVKFTIDSKGRARAETKTVIVGDEERTPTMVRRRKEEQHGKGQRWASSEDDESSTDDEPIIIPSRNTSFALPDPRKLLSRTFHTSQRSVGDQSTSSLGIYYNEQDFADNDAESETETVMNVADSSNRGDAASELRKVVESRQKRAPKTNERFVSRPPYSSGSTISPATLRTSNLLTPNRGNRIRCVCNTTSSNINGDSYMIQWYIHPLFL